ncbi:hypothetical protein CC79DRAFT_906642 [Sarocladium strictum]
MLLCPFAATHTREFHSTVFHTNYTHDRQHVMLISGSLRLTLEGRPCSRVSKRSFETRLTELGVIAAREEIQPCPKAIP